MTELTPLPERATAVPATHQGLFRKFDVKRVDGSDAPGGKHEGCEYFVLDLHHDPHAKIALAAYARAVRRTHPALAADMCSRFGLAAAGADDAPTSFEVHVTGPDDVYQFDDELEAHRLANSINKTYLADRLKHPDDEVLCLATVRLAAIRGDKGYGR